MIFDTHAHYDDEKFQEDRDRILSFLPDFGVEKVVNVAADLGSVETTLLLSQKYPRVFSALGVHPDYVGALTEEGMAHIKALATEYGYRFAENKKNPGAKKVVAIGEIGLDYYWDVSDRAVQKQWFERQLELSKELDLPVIIHSREAAQDTYEVIKSTKTGDGAGVVHCFSYSKEMARQFLDLGYDIGLGGVVTFKNGRVAKEVAAYVPMDRIVLETDAPYLAPVPHRGERNFSGYLTEVAKVIGEIKGMTPEEVTEAARKNGEKLYRIEAFEE